METRPIGISLTLYCLTGFAVLAGVISYLSENTVYIAMITLISAVLLVGGCLATILERIHWSIASGTNRTKDVS